MKFSLKQNDNSAGVFSTKIPILFGIFAETLAEQSLTKQLISFC
jgi:hypothetical protein